ncbi:MAG: hypothetical protein IAF02_12380 [Anaerolineae bacterium]|nr:hypothetical protein [Anaerolineae bacterium]
MTIFPIDTNFDVSFANNLAQLESYNKHIYRPNTYLHKWWARRCGTTFRLILKSLVEDETKQDYYSSGGLENKIILDPMMGGGTTIHEAIRMGANVIGADLDPIPVLQARASLTNISLEELKDAFATVYDGISTVLSPFYKTDCPFCATSVPLQYVLYGWRKHCVCSEALFIDSTTLRYNNDGSIISIDPSSHAILKDETVLFVPEHVPAIPLLTPKNKRCTVCSQPYQEDLSIPYYQRYEPIAIVGHCPTHDLFFTPPRTADIDTIARANEQRVHCGFDPADFSVLTGAKSKSLHLRKIDHYLDLFSSRQLLYLQSAMTHLAQLDPITKLNMALLVSTSLEFNTMLCGYKGDKKRRPGAIRHAFAYHAYSFPYTAIENNPINPTRTSGTLKNLFHSRIERGRIWAANPVERQVKNNQIDKVIITGEEDAGIEYSDFVDLQSDIRRFLLIQGSSTSLDKIPSDSVDAIVTDPPYFDSVQYSDLAAFFRVWLRQFLPDDDIWQYALNDSAVETTTNGNGKDYTTILSGIFTECARVLKENGRFIFTYHHWNPIGWAGLTNALKQSNFILINNYVVHSENLASRHIVGQNALEHDVILVCAPAEPKDISKWKEIDIIRMADSQNFCEDCGSVVGWLLAHDYTKDEISAYWETLFANTISVKNQSNQEANPTISEE